jgi:hypothetical protein
MSRKSVRRLLMPQSARSTASFVTGWGIAPRAKLRQLPIFDAFAVREEKPVDRTYAS